MSNWEKEYRVKFHIDFLHYDGRSESIKNELIIESKTAELSEKIIVDKFNQSYKLLTDIPVGWLGNIYSKNLVIDDIKLVWEYKAVNIKKI